MLGNTRINSGGGSLNKIPMSVKTAGAGWTYPSNLTDDIYASVGYEETIIKGKGIIANNEVWVNSPRYKAMNPLRIQLPLICAKLYSGGAPYYVSTKKIIMDVEMVGGSLKEMFSGADSGYSGYGSLCELDIKIKGNASEFKEFLSGLMHGYGKITLDINPNTYTYCFSSLSSLSSKPTVVDYTTRCTRIDSIIATKGNGNVVKGTLV